MGNPAREAARCDSEQAERVEAELDRVIERRAREAKDAENVEALWKASARVHNERRQRENAARWHDHHMALSDVHRRLAEENERKALRLLNGGEGANA